MTPLPHGWVPSRWETREGTRAVAGHADALLDAKYPGVRTAVLDDPVKALTLVHDVEVRWVTTRPRGACELGGLYEGDRDVPRITVHESPHAPRNHFTCMHELGHHLLGQDEDWQFDVLPALDASQARRVEDKAVNDFAARLLIPDTHVAATLGSSATPGGIVALHARSQASLTACCVRALSEPGERLIFLVSHAGHIWWVGSNGSPYSPGKGVHQPLVVQAIERATESETGTFALFGGAGIQYRSGNSLTDVKVDVALADDDLAVVIATTTPPQARGYVEADWAEACETCGANFTPEQAPERCSKCHSWRCPECSNCSCNEREPAFCEACFLTLPVADVDRGLTRHEDCE